MRKDRFSRNSPTALTHRAAACQPAFFHGLLSATLGLRILLGERQKALYRDLP